MAIFLVIQNQFFSALSYGGSAHTKILGLYCSDSQVANGEREGGCSTFCVSVHGTLDLCLRWSWHRQVFLICGTAPWAGILQHSPQPDTGGTKLITNNQAAVFKRHHSRHTWCLHSHSVSLYQSWEPILGHPEVLGSSQTILPPASRKALIVSSKNKKNKLLKSKTCLRV